MPYDSQKPGGKLAIPSGWTEESMAEAADLIVRLTDTAWSDPTFTEKKSRYQLAQDVFDDKEILTNVNIVREMEPYGVPLLRRQVKGAVRLVVSAFNGANPYYIFRGNSAEPDTELREAREQDTQMMLETMGYKKCLRETGRLGALWARGPYTCDWEEKPKGNGWLDASQVKDGEMEYVGPTRTSILPKDLILYPLSQTELTEMRMVGYRTDLPMFEIWEKQDSGVYFDRETIEVEPHHDQDTAVHSEEDYAPDLLCVIVKLPPGMDRKKPLQAYRCTVAKNQKAMVMMKPYDLPMPNIFAPGFELDPMEFWPSHSLASSMFELQAIVNDTVMARMLGGIAASKKLHYITGRIGEMVTHHFEIGDAIHLPGDAKVYPVDTGTPPDRSLSELSLEARQDAQGVTGFSEVAAGQLPDANQTATATGGALAGTAEEGEEKRQTFFDEELRFIQLIQIYAYRNFKALKKFYGDRLRTKSAKDWQVPFTIEPNGQGPSNNPELTITKLKALVELLASLGIPWLEDVESGAAPNIGLAISKTEFAKAVEQNLDLSMSTEKILVDTTNLAVVPPEPVPAAGFVPTGSPADIGGIPPELLGALAGGVPDPFMGVAPGPPDLMLGAGQLPIPAGPLPTELAPGGNTAY